MSSFIEKISGVPREVHPVLLNVTLTTLDIEFCLKIISLLASLFYLFWRWRIEYLQNKKKKKENE